MIERCWNQDPQHRPDISEVVRCLQTALVPRRDHVDVYDNRVLDDTTLGSVGQRDLPLGKFYFVVFEEFLPSVTERATIPLGSRFLHTWTTFQAPKAHPRTPTHARRRVNQRCWVRRV